MLTALQQSQDVGTAEAILESLATLYPSGSALGHCHLAEAPGMDAWCSWMPFPKAPCNARMSLLNTGPS